MNNEEKNLTPEYEGAEENMLSSSPEAGKSPKKLSNGMLIGIIAGVAVLLVAIILAVLLLGGNNNGGQQGGEGSGDVGDGKTNYVITVVDEEGNPVKGASIFFSPKGGTEFPRATDDKGQVSYKTDKSVTVKLQSLPKGYEYDSLNKTLTPDEDGKLTIVVKKAAAEEPFVVIVVDGEGNPVAGVRVQICDDTGSCRIPRTTDENGSVEYPFEDGQFHAQLSGGLDALPEGYTSDSPDEYVNFDGKTATITIIKIAD